MFPSIISSTISFLLFFALFRFKKYFVLLSPSWYHLDLDLSLRYFPLSFKYVFLLTIRMSRFCLAISLNFGCVEFSNVCCQNLKPDSISLNSFSFSFLWFVAISIATDLIDIFRNSSFPCGSRFVSFSWSILSSISLRKFVRSFILLIKVVSILVIVLRLFLCLFEINFTTTAE